MPQGVSDERGHQAVVPRVQDIHTPRVHRDPRDLQEGRQVKNSPIFPSSAENTRERAALIREVADIWQGRSRLKPPASLETQKRKVLLQASASTSFPVAKQCIDPQFRVLIRHQDLLAWFTCAYIFAFAILKIVCCGLNMAGFIRPQKRKLCGHGILEVSVSKGRSDDLLVGRLVEKTVRAAVKSHRPESQHIGFVHGAKWTRVPRVRPCAESAQFDIGRPICFIVYDASTEVLARGTHISPKVFQQRKHGAPPPAAT